MYVCLCKRITDGQIRQSRMDGVACFDQLQQQLGVSTQCGCCEELARSVFEENADTATESTLFFAAS